MEELCPDVWFLNYTNPMAINCRAVIACEQHPHRRALPQRAGHRVRARHTISASRIREIDYLAAGINHMAFYLRFERDGEDLYPRSARSPTSGEFPRATGCATRC